jgi:hypothetical protein
MSTDRRLGRSCIRFAYDGLPAVASAVVWPVYLCIAVPGVNIRICRDEGRPDHDGLLGHVRRVAGPSNGLRPGWRGAWMQRTPPR